MTLAASGCSIVVVYAVWDRVVRVRFPAPRQNPTRKACSLSSFFRIHCRGSNESKDTALLDTIHNMSNKRTVADKC